MSGEHFSLITLVTKMYWHRRHEKGNDIIQSLTLTGWKYLTSFIDKKKGDQYAFCMFCHTDFSISHGEKKKLKNTERRKKHRDSYKRRFQQSTLKTMFNKDSGGMEDKVCQAEVMFVEYLVEHNLPFAAADHFTKISKCMFSDSEIAKKQSCRRIKWTMIVKNCLDPTYRDPVVDHCRRYFDMQRWAITRFCTCQYATLEQGRPSLKVLN